MTDFDKRFRSMQKSGERQHKFVLGFIVLVGVLMAVVSVMAIYELATLRPEDIGAWFGRLTHAFKASA